MTVGDFESVKQEPLLKPSDVAMILSVSKALVYQLLRQGSIPVVRINHAVRVKPSDLEAFIQKCREEAK
ncbi:MAG: helix-turn-helix domain-containing protein [Anaerolineales bacterium]